MSVDSQVAIILEKITAVVEQNGPAAIQTAQAVVQMNALNNLTGVIFYGALAAFFIFLTVWCRKKWVSINTNPQRKPGDDADGYIVATIVVGIGAIFFSACAVFPLLDVWNWVAIFNPKLALAHEIMKNIL